MNNEIMMGQIKKAFSSLCYEVSMSTSLNQLSINVHAEQFFVELLNELFTYNLVNTNSEEKNFASIDLLDTGNRIAFQITSDSSLKKIKDTLSKLCEKKLHEKVDRIIVLNLIKKNNHKNETLEKDSFKINLKKDIWDYTDLISEINNLNIDRLTSIHALINKYLNPTILFPLPEQDLTSSTIHKLLNGISKLKPIVHPKLPDTTPYTTEAKVSHNNIYQYLKHFDRFQKFAWNIQAQIDYLEENSAPGVAEQLFNYVEQIWMDVSFNEDNPDIIIKKICNEIKDELTKTTSNILTLEDIRYIPFMVFFVFSKCKIFEKPPC
ncbi:SMEK domain-containing protein [Acinetobacter baumannii]|uniref:SMEK domain-containing protein n=1 Tax=Acinetobacter baumannii TaxID=470 RepID=UPI0029575C31|nr:SMEK domain-containing protein [Acinetobacter baumannii]